MSRMSLLVISMLLGWTLFALSDLIYRGWRKFILWIYSKFF